MNRRKQDDRDMSLLGDVMATRKIAPKADRSIPAHDYIDELRQGQLDDRERMKFIWNHVLSLSKPQESDESDTGKFERIYEERQNKQLVAVGSRVFWMLIAGIGTLLAPLITWILTTAYMSSKK